METDDGFTLMELIAIIVIISILVAIGIPKYFNLQDKARQTVVNTAFAELETRAQKLFAVTVFEGTHPDNVDYSTVDTDLGKDFEVTKFDIKKTHIDVTIKYTIDDGNWVYHKKIKLLRFSED